MTRRLLLCLLLLTPGCAARSAPLQVLQVSHDALATAQDLEVQLCFNLPNVAAASTLADPSHCTAPGASALGLTDARHRALSRQFVTAFTLHKSATILAASGGIPDLTELQGSLRSLLILLGDLQPSPQVTQLTSLVKASQIR